ncbi:ABC transporter G family member 20-like [Oppia nitens]|uniref:ABC transporter G family member 20-like n=1 Tax=Oppia nitens TaxID=1686743 RepID=UPI0023DC6084|nr:ABC transporter G family member 20-like [Oppia nitens]
MEPQLIRINIFDKNNTFNYTNDNIYSILDSRPAIDVHKVDFGYNKDNLILNNLTIKIPKGRIFGLLGTSGCGKTTLLRLVLGRLQPKSGIIKVFGIRPSSSKSNIPGKGVGYMPQETALFSEFTITEMLYYFGILYDMDLSKIKERINHLKDLLNLPQKDRLIGQLSGGQQRLVSMAVTMFHKPPLLILDEPTVGVDSILRCRIWEYLEDMCQTDGTTVVITTHYLEEATNASNIAYIQSGTLLIQSKPRELLNTYECLTLEETFLKISIEKKQNKRPIDRSPKHLNESIGVSRNIQNLCPKHKKVIDWKHIKALLWRSQIRITRNPIILLMLLMLPVIQITLFCICTGSRPQDIPIAVHKPDIDNHLSHEFLQYIDRNVIREDYYKDKDIAINSVINGKSYFALLFPQNFSNSLEARIHNPYELSDEEIADSQVKVYADMTYSAVSPLIYHSFLESSQKFLNQYMLSLGYNPRAVSLPFTIEKPIYGQMDSTLYEFTAPGVIIATIHVTTMLFSSLLIVIERKDGHLDRGLVAGLNSSEILISHIIMIFLCVIAKCFLLMFFSFILFDIPLKGSVWDAFALITLQGLQGMSFGLLISVMNTEESIALILVFSIVFPMWFISAVFWPIEAIPKYLHIISYMTPLTLPIDALRSILLRNWSAFDDNVLYGYITSLAYILVLLFLSFVMFRKSCSN